VAAHRVIEVGLDVRAAAYRFGKLDPHKRVPERNRQRSGYR
jgi:hypothetical protein